MFALRTLTFVALTAFTFVSASQTPLSNPSTEESCVAFECPSFDLAGKGIKNSNNNFSGLFSCGYTFAGQCWYYDKTEPLPAEDHYVHQSPLPSLSTAKSNPNSRPIAKPLVLHRDLSLPNWLNDDR